MRSLLGKLSLALALVTAPQIACAQSSGLWESLTGSKSGDNAPKVPANLPPANLVNQSEMEIPFAVSKAPTDANAMVSVFVSWDQGKNWNHFKDIPAAEGKFRFRVKQDLEFWFVTRIALDDKSKRIAPGTPPQLRVMVDTQKPVLKVTPRVTEQGKIEVVWEMADPHLEPSSLKLEYQDAMGASNPWMPVTIGSRHNTVAAGRTFGRISFDPQVNSSTVNVRAEVSDTAGNKQFFSEQVTISGRAKVLEKPVPSTPDVAGNDDLAASRWPADNSLPESGIPSLGSPQAMAQKDNSPRNGMTLQEDVARSHESDVPNSSRRPGRLATSARPEPPEELLPAPEKTEPNLDLPTFENKVRSGDRKLPDLRFSNEEPPKAESEPERAATPEMESPAPTRPTTPEPSAPTEELLPPAAPVVRSERPRINTDDGIGPIQDPPATESLTPVPGTGASDALVPLAAGESPRLTNTRRFTLDYDLESVGPEGIKEIELWGTTDNGMTWSKWGSDQDKVSPMEVEVNNEANYGFRIVIVGNNGLEGNKPQRGDAADIYVGVDTTRPLCKIISAAYGKGIDAGKLDIRWEASDLHLGGRCVTLSYGDRPDGHFTVIAAGIENNGRYLWQCDPHANKQVYLQLEVRDEAGNLSVERLSDPIQIEGLVPKGKIRSLTPSNAAPARGAFRTPLFR